MLQPKGTRRRLGGFREAGAEAVHDGGDVEAATVLVGVDDDGGHEQNAGRAPHVAPLCIIVRLQLHARFSP